MKHKPDRWERMVEDAALINGEDRFLDASTIVTLLRQQHRAVVNIIQKDIRRYKKIVAETGVTRDDHMHAHAAWTALDNLLDQLKQRAT